jgi:putative oxidoreductase
MRIIIGLSFAVHGSQKLFGMPGGQARMALASLMGFAGIIEFVGGLLVAFGLLAGYAAFIASGQMAFAYFMVHFKQGFWPTLNGGELAVLYCFIFLFIASHGSGVWSIDAIIKAMRKPTS